MDLEYVFGAQPVSEALRANRRKFKTLYLRSGDLDNDKLLRSERYALFSIVKKLKYFHVNFHEDKFEKTWNVKPLD